MSLLMKALASAEQNKKAIQKPELEPALELEALEAIEAPSTPLEITDAFKDKRQAAANMFNASAPEVTTSNQFSYLVIGLLALVFIIAVWFTFQLIQLNENESEVLMAQDRPRVAAIDPMMSNQNRKINSVIAHQLEEPIQTAPTSASQQPKPAKPKPQKPQPNTATTANKVTGIEQAPPKPNKNLGTQTEQPIKAVQTIEPATVTQKATIDSVLPVVNATPEVPLPPLVAPEDQSVASDRVIFGEINSGSDPLSTIPASNNQAANAQQSTVAAAPYQRTNIEVSSKRHEASVAAPLLAAYNAFVAGDNTKAKALYRSVLKNDVRQVDALLGMAAIAQRQSRDKDAVGWYKKVLEIEPRNSTALTGIVSSFPNANPVSQIDRLNQLIEKQPTVASHHAALGNLYSEQNAWAKAQSAYFNANRYDKSNPDYAFNLAVSLEHLGKPALAAAQYQRALTLVNQTGASSPNKKLIEARLEALK